MAKIVAYLNSSPHLRLSVVGFLLKGDKVLLGLRKSSSLGLGLDLVSGIGGGVEFGETNQAAFLRELEEEVGKAIKIPNLDQCRDMGRVRFLFPNKPKWNHDVRIYLVEEGNWSGKPVETEAVKPIFFKKSALPLKQMWPDNAVWVPLILNGKKIDAIFLLAQDGSIIEQQLKVTKS